MICQTALLCQCLLLYCLPTLIYGDTQISGLYTYVILIAHAFSGPSYIAITWIVLALAIERYFALRKPFAYRAMATAGFVKKLIGKCYLKEKTEQAMGQVTEQVRLATLANASDENQGCELIHQGFHKFLH